MNLTTLLALSILSSSVVSEHLHPDKVISLPGAPLYPKFDIFSGYLNGSSNDHQIPIFYVLAKAIRGDSSTAPLVLWFNGGPGGSSLAGFLAGNGPYRVTEEGSRLDYNEFSWNQYANVIYLESPLGVGFSQNSEGDLTSNDIDAAEINFNALRDFMTRSFISPFQQMIHRVHPNYADRDYYLSGQSYAGAYIPYFARRLLIGIEEGEMRNGNFKGFAIGNPVFNTDAELMSQAMQFLSYGLLELSHTEVVFTNWMELQRSMTVNVSALNEVMESIHENIVPNYLGRNSPRHYNYREHCYKNIKLSESDYHVPIDKQSIACYGKYALNQYMNRFDVQVALHAGDASIGSKHWTNMNTNLGHNYDRDHYILPVYDDIIVNGSSFRILIYHGDMDVMIPTAHTISSTSKIAKDNSMKKENYEKTWRFYGDFAGIRMSYSKENTTMDVLTVRGSGHSVPTDLPAQAFQMINKFLSTGENEKIDYSEPILKH